MAGFYRAAWDRLRALGLNLWNHRTKVIGVLGVVAGYLESFLETHSEIQLPARGVLLVFFGCIVFAVGFYNSLAAALSDDGR